MGPDKFYIYIYKTSFFRLRSTPDFIQMIAEMNLQWLCHNLYLRYRPISKLNMELCLAIFAVVAQYLALWQNQEGGLDMFVSIASYIAARE